MLTQPTLEKLRQMRLAGMAKGLLSQLKNPACQSLSFEERLGLLVDQEWTYRSDPSGPPASRGPAQVPRLYGRHRLPPAPGPRPALTAKPGYRPVACVAPECDYHRSHRGGEDFHRLRPGACRLPAGACGPLLPGAPVTGRSGPGQGRRLLSQADAHAGQDRSSRSRRVGHRPLLGSRLPRDLGGY